jgi:hypothetical protein
MLLLGWHWYPRRLIDGAALERHPRKESIRQRDEIDDPLGEILQFFARRSIAQPL